MLYNMSPHYNSSLLSFTDFTISTAHVHNVYYLYVYNCCDINKLTQNYKIFTQYGVKVRMHSNWLLSNFNDCFQFIHKCLMTKARSDVGKIAATNVIACRTILSVVLTNPVSLVL